MKAAASALAKTLGSTPAWAVYTVTVRETVAGLLVTGSGSSDLSGLTRFSDATAAPQVFAGTGLLILGGDAGILGALDGYRGASLTSPRFGDCRPANATAATGEGVGVAADVGQIYVPDGYVSGADLGSSVGKLGHRSSWIGGLSLLASAARCHRKPVRPIPKRVGACTFGTSRCSSSPRP